jgi:hypothetical protein
VIRLTRAASALQKTARICGGGAGDVAALDVTDHQHTESFCVSDNALPLRVSVGPKDLEKC